MSARARLARRRPAVVAISVAAVFLVLVVLDRVAAYTASQLAARSAREQGASSAQIRIGGFPFLTQVIAGKLSHLTVHETGLTGDGVRIDRLDADAHGVHAGLADAVRGHVRAVPIDDVRGTAVISYASLTSDLTKRLGLRGGLALALAPHGTGDLTVTATGPLGLRVSQAIPVPAVSGGALQLGAFARKLFPILPGITDAVAVPLPKLPYGLTLSAARAQPDGLPLQVVGRHVTVRR